MSFHLPAAKPQSFRVLVIEDDPILGHLLKKMLQRFTGDVSLATTGKEAMALASEEFDAVACDISLPDASGLDIIAAIRESQPSTGIVAVTGMIDVDVAVQSMKAGADDFLGKPFEPEILWHILHKAVDNRKQRIKANQAAAYRKLAYTDALTGCSNRRFIDEYLEHAVEAAQLTGQPLWVGYVDLDNFKLLNDFVGHEQGDMVLQSLSDALEDVIEPPDVFGRFGGDEFVVVFPNGTEAHADLVLDRLRARVERFKISNGDQLTLPTRISCGVSQFTGTESPRDLVAAAEDQMYLDKGLAPVAFGMRSGAYAPDPVAAKVTNLRALRSLVKAIDRRDRYTRFHSDHATHLALRVAKDLGLDDESVNALMIGGPIHDLGKIVVPDEVLRKPGKLTTEERRQMEEHPIVGAAITAAVTDYDAVVNLVRHHHERFDGEGYPGRLKGHEVPLTTRLFTIADAFSAMTTDRPYRRGLSPEQAIAEVARGAGKQFDGDLAPVFIQAMEKQLAEEKADAA